MRPSSTSDCANWKQREPGPRVLYRALNRVVRSAEDHDLFRINPIAFATARNVSESEAIDLFLEAAAIGMFRMDWMVICPLCSSVIESFGSLKALSTDHYHCHFCQNTYTATLDDYIAVSFTIAPSIREIRFHTPEDLLPFEYMLHYAFSGPHHHCDVPKGASGLSPSQIVEHCFRGCEFVSPGSSATFEFIGGKTPLVGDSTIQCTEVLSGAFCLIRIEGRPCH